MQKTWAVVAAVFLRYPVEVEPGRYVPDQAALDILGGFFVTNIQVNIRGIAANLEAYHLARVGVDVAGVVAWNRQF